MPSSSHSLSLTTPCLCAAQTAYLTFFMECGIQLPLQDDPSYQMLADSCVALPPSPPPPAGLWQEPTGGSAVEVDVVPCHAETIACQSDEFCEHFTRETLAGASLADCHANALCDAMVACAMSLALDGRPPPPPPAPPLPKQPAGNNDCGVPACDGPQCCEVVRPPEWEDGGCTWNLGLQIYEGGCSGCEPCTAACTVEAAVGMGDDHMASSALIPCQLGSTYS